MSTLLATIDQLREENESQEEDIVEGEYISNEFHTSSFADAMLDALRQLKVTFETQLLDLGDIIRDESEKDRAQNEKFDEERKNEEELKTPKKESPLDGFNPKKPKDPDTDDDGFSFKEGFLGLLAFVFADIVGMFAIAKGMVMKSFALIKKTFKVLTKVLKSGLMKLIAPITFIIGFYEGFMETEGDTAEKMIGGVFGGIKKMLKTLVMWPADMVKNAISWIAGKLGFEDVSNFLDGFSFQEAVDPMMETFKDFIGFLSEKVQSFVLWLGDVTHMLGQKFDAIGEWFNGVKDKISGLFGKVQQFDFSDIDFLSPIRDIVASLINKIPYPLSKMIPPVAYEFAQVDPETGNRITQGPAGSSEADIAAEENAAAVSSANKKARAGDVTSKENDINALDKIGRLETVYQNEATEAAERGDIERYETLMSKSSELATEKTEIQKRLESNRYGDTQQSKSSSTETNTNEKLISTDPADPVDQFTVATYQGVEEDGSEYTERRKVPNPSYDPSLSSRVEPAMERASVTNNLMQRSHKSNELRTAVENKSSAASANIVAPTTNNTSNVSNMISQGMTSTKDPLDSYVGFIEGR
jgi:hypothetical protein